MSKTPRPGKKGKFSNDIQFVRSALSAYKLVAYMNLTHAFDGSRLVCNIGELITGPFYDDYLGGLEGQEPSFSSVKVDNDDRSMFMTLDWMRLNGSHKLLDLFKDPARWKDLLPFAQVYFFDAALRTLNPSERVFNLDLRFGDSVLKTLKTKSDPVSYIRKRLRDNIRRLLNIDSELYLVLETQDRQGGLNVHLHGSLLVDPNVDVNQLKHAIKLALGKDYEAARQIKINPPFPRRAAYLSKQALNTPVLMLEAGFSSNKFISATNNVRNQAKELWEDEMRVTDGDYVIDPHGARKDTKPIARFLDLGVHADRTALKEHMR